MAETIDAFIAIRNLIIAAVSGAVILALAASAVAWSKRTMFMFDLGALILPAIAVALIGYSRQVMDVYGLILWPSAVLLGSVYAFGCRVFVADKLFGQPRANSMYCFYALTCIGVAIGLFAPAWGE